MAGVTGLEPAASGVTGQRSNQLSYTPDPIFTGESGACMRKLSFTCAHGLCQAQWLRHEAARHSCVSQVYQSPELYKEMVGGDGIEPPTLSV